MTEQPGRSNNDTAEHSAQGGHNAQHDAQPSYSNTCTGTSQASGMLYDSNTPGTPHDHRSTELPASTELQPCCDHLKSNSGDSCAVNSEHGSPPPESHCNSPGKLGQQASKSRQMHRGGPCVECGATTSVLFRKSMTGEPLCNACGLRLQRRLGKGGSGRPKGANTPFAAATAAAVAAAGLPNLAGLPVDAPVASSFGSLKPSPSGGFQGAAGSSGGKRSRKRGAGDSSKPAATRRRLPVEGQKCVYCGATQSPQWRYVGSNLACNACALQRKRRAQRSNSDPNVCAGFYLLLLQIKECCDVSAWIHHSCAAEPSWSCVKMEVATMQKSTS